MKLLYLAAVAFLLFSDDAFAAEFRYAAAPQRAPESLTNHQKTI
ncbi:MAG: hypothetical protein ACXVB9_12720 [Bdellovibrionota bacterium]